LEKIPIRISKDEADEQQVHSMIPKTEIHLWRCGVGSEEEAWMKSHKSEVAITFIYTPTNQETVSVLEKTQTNKTFRT